MKKITLLRLYKIKLNILLLINGLFKLCSSAFRLQPSTFVFVLFLLFNASLFAKFGLNPEGVINSFNPHEKKIIAFTFDACSGKYDRELIDFLIKNKIKATLFISGRWIDKNKKILKYLSQIKYFEIENHGLTHRPLSIDCKSAYGIRGTCSKQEIIDEVIKNERKIYKITKIKTKFFRAGTAHYDSEAINIVKKLGYKIIGFNVNADFGATASIQTIYKQLINAKPGSIVIAHMNHPERNTFEGFKAAIIELKKRGFKFVKLEEIIK